MLKKQKSRSKSNLPSILTSQGTKIECVSKYKYLGILIDESIFYLSYSAASKKIQT